MRDTMGRAAANNAADGYGRHGYAVAMVLLGLVVVACTVFAVLGFADIGYAGEDRLALAVPCTVGAVGSVIAGVVMTRVLASGRTRLFPSIGGDDDPAGRRGRSSSSRPGEGVDL